VGPGEQVGHVEQRQVARELGAQAGDVLGAGAAEANREVSRRLVAAMESIRSVLERNGGM
jgi:hypothetical protein